MALEGDEEEGEGEDQGEVEMGGVDHDDGGDRQRGEGRGGQEQGEERDLDDDIPDAADGDGDEELDDDGMVDEEGEGTELMDGLIRATQDEGRRIGVDMADEEAERDLDDEVPEAGSYQHTDTEAELDEEDDDSYPHPPIPPRSAVVQPTQTPSFTNRRSGVNNATTDNGATHIDYRVRTRANRRTRSSLLGSSSAAEEEEVADDSLQGRGSSMLVVVIDDQGRRHVGHASSPSRPSLPPPAVPADRGGRGAGTGRGRGRGRASTVRGARGRRGVQ